MRKGIAVLCAVFATLGTGRKIITTETFESIQIGMTCEDVARTLARKPDMATEWQGGGFYMWSNSSPTDGFLTLTIERGRVTQRANTSLPQPSGKK